MPARIATDPRRHRRFPGGGSKSSTLLLLVGILGITGFVLWAAVTLTPVIRVEAQFQAQRVLREVFGTTSLIGIFQPRVSLDLRGSLAENTQDGIVIPKIYVDAPVIYNVDPNNSAAYTPALKQGIAHASGTSFPDEGGLGYYFAHSSAPELRSQFNAVFYLLGKMEMGDEVFLWHGGKRTEYVVTEIKTVPPTDVSFLNTEYPEEMIVLQTCWPPGTTLQRRLVFAKRVE